MPAQGVAQPQGPLFAHLSRCHVLAPQPRSRSLILTATHPAGAPADRPLPSLVVCPSTLVQHWPYEIAKFVGPEALRPLAYHGAPAERAALRCQLADHDVLVMSYESLRAGAAGAVWWLWCVCVGKGKGQHGGRGRGMLSTVAAILGGGSCWRFVQPSCPHGAWHGPP